MEYIVVSIIYMVTYGIVYWDEDWVLSIACILWLDAVFVYINTYLMVEYVDIVDELNLVYDKLVRGRIMKLEFLLLKMLIKKNLGNDIKDIKILYILKMELRYVFIKNTIEEMAFICQENNDFEMKIFFMNLLKEKKKKIQEEEKLKIKDLEQYYINLIDLLYNEDIEYKKDNKIQKQEKISIII